MRGRGWGYFILGVYENYDNSKGRDANDPESYDYFELCNDTSDFYYMVSEWYKKNPELGLKVCNEGAATVIVVLLPVMEKVAAKMK
jgi:hypothetical protein